MKCCRWKKCRCVACRSPHGERGLKSDPSSFSGAVSGRSPHGERGLKSLRSDAVRKHLLSLPTRGAWIEMPDLLYFRQATKSLPTRGAWIEIGKKGSYWASNRSRSPHGERGLKYSSKSIFAPHTQCRSPHGERGLKLLLVQTVAAVFGSLPTRGAWIEIAKY